MFDDLYCVILAAGDGTRMKSELPKVLHKVCGKPMISILVDNLKKIGVKNIIAVTGYKRELIKSELGGKVEYVAQKELLGTGHALLQTKDLLQSKKGKLLVLCGDAPLIQEETLKNFIEFSYNKCDASVITMEFDDPSNYGRIVKDNAGNVLKIVEETDASVEEVCIKEINSGMYCFNIEDVFSSLDKISCENKQKEYYLTDVIHILNKEDKRIKSFCLEDNREAIGVNSRYDLILAEKFLKEKLIEKIINKGVTIVAPDLIYIETDVEVGKETVINPFVKISRGAIIGKNCVIESFVDIKKGQIVGNGEILKA